MTFAITGAHKRESVESGVTVKLCHISKNIDT